MNAAETLITKGAFAAHRGVTPAAVSQYISAGHLDGALYRRDGTPATRDERSALVHRDKADESLRRRLNTAQVIGQGKTVPPRVAAAPAPAASPTGPDGDDAADRLQRARADQAEMAAERERRSMAAEAGRYVLAASAKAEFAKTLSDLVASVETWLPDLAGALVAAIAAAEVEGRTLDRRALLAAIHAEWRGFRAARAKSAADRRDGETRLVHDPEPELEPDTESEASE